MARKPEGRGVAPAHDGPPRVLLESLERGVLDGVRELEGEADRVRVDLGLVPVFADERPLLGLAGLIDWRSSGRLSALVRAGLCSGAAGEQLLMPGDARLPMDRLVLIGLGPREQFDGEAARSVARRLVEIAVDLSARSVVIALPAKHIERSLAEDLFEALIAAVEAALRARPRERDARSEVDDEREAEPPAEPEDEDEDEAPSEAAGQPEREGEGASEEPAEGSEPELSADEGQPALPSQPRETESSPRPPARWWVVADGPVVARLRRVLSGPPRAARGSSLHT